MGLLLSWLGMKTIAGYSWVLFIIAAWKHLLEINDVMGMWGAVFVLTIALSLFLQVKDLTVLGDFMQEFRSNTNPWTDRVRKEIRTAASDLQGRVSDIIVNERTSFASSASGGSRPTRSTVQESGVSIDFEALDVNKDGVIDEKDFVLLQKSDNLK